MITKIFNLSLLFFVMQVSSQQLLTKEDAVKLALENNYGIKVSNNDLEIAKNNKSILNSGYLPTLTGNAGAVYNVDNTEAEFSNGNITSLTGAESNRENASLNLNYTLFDGFGRKYNYKQLKEQYNLSELQARETIENTLLQLFSVYFNVAKLTQDVSLLNQSLTISQDRLDRVQYQFDYGQNNKLAVLNAEVDVNNDSINLISSQQLLSNAKRDLNVVLGKDNFEDFEVDTLVNFTLTPNREQFLEKVETNNVTLKQFEKSIQISDFQLKANRSGYLPTIGLSGSYGWNKNNNNAASFLSTSTNTGLSAGLNLTWDIFDSGRTRTLVQNAKINLDSQRLLEQQIKLEINREFNNAWEDYQTKLFILQTQRKNVQTNINNFKRTEEQFKIGQVSSIEFRLAQVNLLNAVNARNSAKYEAKLAELQLLQLTGDLLNSEF